MPVFINYCGDSEKLFKRDFCDEMLDKLTDFKLVDYEFCYKRDQALSRDDITWFLLQKIQGFLIVCFSGGFVNKTICTLNDELF